MHRLKVTSKEKSSVLNKFQWQCNGITMTTPINAPSIIATPLVCV